MPNLHVVRTEQESGRSKASGALDSYQLVTKSGVALGLIELARPDWPLGILIDRDATKLRVIEVVLPEGHGELPILVVEPT
jgi:hypothetical protein